MVAVPKSLELTMADTVTVWQLVIEDGAVYRPAEEIVPTDGLSDQKTAVLPLAVKVWV